MPKRHHRSGGSRSSGNQVSSIIAGSVGTVMSIGLVFAREPKQSRGTAAFRASTLLSLPAERYTDQIHHAELLGQRLPLRRGHTPDIDRPATAAQFDLLQLQE